MPRVPQKKNLQEYSEGLAQAITDDVYKVIDNSAGGNRYTENYLVAMFVSRLIGEMVHRTLAERSTLNISHKDQEDLMMKNMSELKMAVQNAVAAGFQNAMSNFLGRPVEYYCQIKPVPEPVSNAAH